jgi:hypothetical protein
VNLRFRWLPDFHFYEYTNDAVELRLSMRWFWFSLNMLIRLLPPRENGRRFDDRDRGWGWYFIDSSLKLEWGDWHTYWDLPFTSCVLCATQILSLSRNRVVFDATGKKFLDTYEERQKVIDANCGNYPYRYELLNGEQQMVTAKVHVERHIRRRKWLPFRVNDDSILVEFSEEVGSERGSWKGGCTGCGWTMRPKETVLACVRRMERERRFDR